MATAPLPDPAAAAPMPAADPAPAPDAKPGYCVCICVDPDGQMLVGTKPMDPGMDVAGMKPVANVREAMAMAMDIVTSNGEMPGGEEDEEDADFAEGFGKAPPAKIDKVRDVEDMA